MEHPHDTGTDSAERPGAVLRALVALARRPPDQAGTPSPLPEPEERGPEERG